MCGLHECDQPKRQHLHDQDKGLIDAALAVLVPTLPSAPDRDEGAGKSGKPSGYTAEETGGIVAGTVCISCRNAWPQQHVGTIGNQEQSYELHVLSGCEMSQEIDPDRQSKGTAEDEPAEISPVNAFLKVMTLNNWIAMLHTIITCTMCTGLPPM